MTENYARERIDNDFEPLFPSKDIVCKKCVYRKAGVLGYRTAYCEMYKDGKPNGILFNNEQCLKYKEELWQT